MKYSATILAVLLVVLAIPAFGASNYLGGMSGNLYTPDDIVTPRGTWELSYHDTLNGLRNGDDMSTTGLQYGLIKNLEVGVTAISGNGTSVAFNGKYMLIPETATIPNVSVGVFDAASQVGKVNGDPSVYILISKNITPYATRLVGYPSKPLQITLGTGSGIYKAFFAGLNWTFTPKVQLLFDYTNGTIDGRDHIASAGIRYAVANTVRLDAAFFDFREFAFGASVRSTFR